MAGRGGWKESELPVSWIYGGTQTSCPSITITGMLSSATRPHLVRIGAGLFGRCVNVLGNGMQGCFQALKRLASSRSAIMLHFFTHLTIQYDLGCHILLANFKYRKHLDHLFNNNWYPNLVSNRCV